MKKLRKFRTTYHGLLNFSKVNSYRWPTSRPEALLNFWVTPSCQTPHVIIMPHENLIENLWTCFNQIVERFWFHQHILILKSHEHIDGFYAHVFSCEENNFFWRIFCCLLFGRELSFWLWRILCFPTFFHNNVIYRERDLIRELLLVLIFVLKKITSMRWL